MPGSDSPREPTDEERRSTNYLTPRKLDKRIRISAPDGITTDATIEFEDGEKILNVLRAVVLFDAVDGDKLTKVFITRFDPEIGLIVYEEAECLVG